MTDPGDNPKIEGEWRLNYERDSEGRSFLVLRADTGAVLDLALVALGQVKPADPNRTPWINVGRDEGQLVRLLNAERLVDRDGWAELPASRAHVGTSPGGGDPS